MAYPATASTRSRWSSSARPPFALELLSAFVPPARMLEFARLWISSTRGYFTTSARRRGNLDEEEGEQIEDHLMELFCSSGAYKEVLERDWRDF